MESETKITHFIGFQEAEPVNDDQFEEGNTSRDGDLSGTQERQNQHAADNLIGNTDDNAIQTIRRRRNPSKLLAAGKVVKEALDNFVSTLKRTDAPRQPNK